MKEHIHSTTLGTFHTLVCQSMKQDTLAHTQLRQGFPSGKLVKNTGFWAPSSEMLMQYISSRTQDLAHLMCWSKDHVLRTTELKEGDVGDELKD